jgi:P27 family predicted phage terminase small subunit
MKPKKRPEIAAPGHLSAESAALWSQLAADYGMAGDAAGLAILTSAMEARDRMGQARKTLDKEGLTVPGDRGGTKAHPVAAIERDNRQAFLAAMKALRLDIEPTRPAPGRPPSMGGF